MILGKLIQKVIAASEVVGGTSGLALVGYEARSEYIQDTLEIGIIIVLLYVLALVGGVLLWRQRKSGIWISAFIQTVQLLKIQASQFVFSMSFGFDLYPMILRASEKAGYGFGLMVKIGGTHAVYIGNPGFPLGIGFSLISVIFLTCLVYARKSTETLTRPVKEIS